MSVTRDWALRCELEDLYARYAAALDDGPLAEWPDFFTADCFYLIQPRDNFELGLPIAIMRCESRDMLLDRVRALEETMLYEPRYLRHHITNLRVIGDTAAGLETSANFSVIEVLPQELPQVLICGRYLDVVVRGDDGWRFREKRCVFDSILVRNSLIYPV
jgi:salicylate 5-hydroxylase small subunit